MVIISLSKEQVYKSNALKFTIDGKENCIGSFKKQVRKSFYDFFGSACRGIKAISYAEGLHPMIRRFY
jgi:hypothetical protein